MDCVTCQDPLPEGRVCKRCTACQRDYMTRWKAENRAKLAASKAAYYRKNKARQRAWGANHRARSHGAEGSVSARERRAIWAAFEGKCAYCGEEADTFDHMVPLVRGGEHEVENLVPSCLACNMSKKDRTPLEWFLLQSDIVGLKRCITCLTDLPPERFYANPNTRDKLASSCIPCTVEYYRQRRSAARAAAS